MAWLKQQSEITRGVNFVVRLLDVDAATQMRFVAMLLRILEYKYTIIY